MTEKQEQQLIAELRKVITAMDKVRDLANKLGATTTAGYIQGITPRIKLAIDYHEWHKDNAPYAL